jgi:hypothetical protein
MFFEPDITMKWLCIAWGLRHAEIFKNVTRIIQHEGDHKIEEIGPENLPISEIIIGKTHLKKGPKLPANNDTVLVKEHLECALLILCI